jgi:hypothetical protein
MAAGRAGTTLSSSEGRSCLRDEEGDVEIDLASGSPILNRRIEKWRITALCLTASALVLAVAVAGAWTWQSAGTAGPTTVIGEATSSAAFADYETADQSFQRAGATGVDITTIVYLVNSLSEKALIDELRTMSTDSHDVLSGITLVEIIRAVYRVPASTDVVLIGGSDEETEHSLQMLRDVESAPVGEGLPGIQVIDLRTR